MNILNFLLFINELTIVHELLFYIIVEKYNINMTSQDNSTVSTFKTGLFGVNKQIQDTPLVPVLHAFLGWSKFPGDPSVTLASGNACSCPQPSSFLADRLAVTLIPAVPGASWAGSLWGLACPFRKDQETAVAVHSPALTLVEDLFQFSTFGRPDVEWIAATPGLLTSGHKQTFLLTLKCLVNTLFLYVPRCLSV